MAKTQSKTLGLGAGALLAGATLSAAVIWLMIALPVLEGAKAAAHDKHYLSVIVHAAGGTAMLFVGATALYIGLSRNAFRFHKIAGYLYLSGGGLGAGSGLVLSILNPHPLPGASVATGLLAATWIAVAAMALRAARNKRFDSHRQWMIRSCVLTWTFVFCRIVMTSPFGKTFDPPMIVATIWATWITPLLLCELALQWRAGSRDREIVR
ncbi:MAG: DUF2306 domain-containing protein [Parvularculaceae bacterium]